MKYARPHKWIKLKCPEFITKHVRCLGDVTAHTPFEDPGYFKKLKDDHATGIVRIDEPIAGVIQHLWRNEIITFGCCCEDYLSGKSRLTVSSKHSEEDIKRIRKLIKESDDVKNGKVSNGWDIFQWKRCKV